MGRRAGVLRGRRRRHEASGGFDRAAVLLAGVTLVFFGIIVLVGGAPVAWLLLGFCGVASAAAFAIQLRHGRFFEPLTVIAGFALISLSGRALQLFIGAKDLLSFYPTGDPTDEYLRIETSEKAQFATELLKQPLEGALTRAIAAVAIFVALVVVGYLLPWGPRLGERLERVGRRVTRPPNLRALVLACLAIAALGQAKLLVKVGGPGEALDTSFRHSVLRGGLVDHFLVGFGVVALLIWMAWSPPGSTRARVAFGLATLEMCAFFALAGSRTRVVLLLGMLAIVVHYMWRRWRPVELVGALPVVVLFATALLGIRQATSDKTTGEALGSAPTYLKRPEG